MECNKPRDPMKTWRNAAPWVRGGCADRYLKTRGIDLTNDEARSLRFAPSLWHWPSQSRWPAMLARVSLASGVEITTHQTFVRHDGSAKAPLGKQSRLFAAGGCTIGGGRVVRRRRSRSRICRRRRDRIHAQRHAHFWRQRWVRGPVDVRNLHAGPTASSPPGAHFHRSRRAWPGPRRCARRLSALARRRARGCGVDISQGRRRRQ